MSYMNVTNPEVCEKDFLLPDATSVSMIHHVQFVALFIVLLV
jgi:hypothetical protein